MSEKSSASEMGTIKPIGYARKQDLLQYRPAVMMYDKPIAPENGHEAVKLYSEDQVNAAVLAEREACAQIVDDASVMRRCETGCDICRSGCGDPERELANRIRARGQA